MALVALSGGVDSSVVLAMALEDYDVVRAAWLDTGGTGTPEEAIAVASRLGVPLDLVDSRESFRREVVSWSRGMLQAGLTPNPCARCNARVKFLSLFRLLHESEDLLTGHYARMEDGSLRRGRDISKDQSYFLAMVAREVLSRCVFPLGSMLKTGVREMARHLGLPCRPEESMDLCFETVSRGRPGRIVDVRGNTLGEHRGIENFTVGQRRGLGALGKRMYVVSLDPLNGTVTVGDRSCLLSSGCIVEEMNWLVRPESFPLRARVQTRYRRKPVPAVLDEDGGCLHIDFTRA
jgi:tRNA-specific 2-thiouridylase